MKTLTIKRSVEHKDRKIIFAKEFRAKMLEQNRNRIKAAMQLVHAQKHVKSVQDG